MINGVLDLVELSMGLCLFSLLGDSKLILTITTTVLHRSFYGFTSSISLLIDEMAKGR
jgi:hypothetical protein